ncbi:G8 domain-containing protein [Singulisphaera sp. PoT]|uniref:G8 domain-containing protein n=1 Tax=Singulisphaera sp. PoT TaxID=3411797 RepID=UPI003BF5A6E8
MSHRRLILFCSIVFAAAGQVSAEDLPPLVRSAASGPWSAPSTWEGGKLPAEGSRVQVKGGHTVVYDLNEGAAIRSIHVAGILEFARDRDTRLEVGLIKVQPGDDASENGFDCDAHGAMESNGSRPALLVGLPGEPIPAGKKALIRLKHFKGLDPVTCPAIISCGGRMEFHGAPLERTWVKLGREAYRDEPIVLLKQSEIAGWKPGDHLILTGTTRQFGYKQTRTVSVAERPSTEERHLKSIKSYVESGLALVTLDKPLEFDHRAQGDYRAEVANLTRNVVVESADPDGVRGHTMYHKHSSGSISYAEFRHLGKEGVLGKYSLHFHLAGESMRGGSVIGASIWDSKNRWITVHGTSYLVFRDNVGYKSVGHGFFLEDGTETRNVFDRNLAVMALRGKPLPDQVLPYDKNLGSGFWWANSLNTFTNNVAAECDQDGFRFEVFAGDGFDPSLRVLQPDGKREKTDIRTLPFIRFENNEAHCQRFFGFNLGGFSDGGVPGYPGPGGKIEDVDGVGPDRRHPFLIKNYRAWDTHWAFHAGSPSVRAEGMDLYDSQYGIWRTVMDHHEYSSLKMDRIISMGIFLPRPGRSAKDDPISFLQPVDDFPPSTMITGVTPIESTSGLGRRVRVRGASCDNSEIRRVLVNGHEASPTRQNFAEWELELELTQGESQTITAHAEDSAGNREKVPHAIPLSSPSHTLARRAHE